MIKLLVLVLIFSACTQNKKNHKLKLFKAYELQTNGQLEPSGLTFWDGEFFTISDKHDKIYKLVFLDNRIKLIEHITIINNRGTKLDFEGITHDNDNFYLVSEKYFDILKVSKNGKKQNWLIGNEKIKQAGEKIGLFTTPNANFEGLCLLANGSFLLAAERQPRGFVEYNPDTKNIDAYLMDSPVFDYSGNRSPDFTGLSCDDGIYVLDRNAETIAKLELINNQFQETTGYSYKHITFNDKFTYQDMTYGQAEGLVVKDNKFYIILDNNRSFRKDSSDNNNSLFLVFTLR